jgi:hypothetical protein
MAAPFLRFLVNHLPQFREMLGNQSLMTLPLSIETKRAARNPQ